MKRKIILLIGLCFCIYSLDAQEFYDFYIKNKNNYAELKRFVVGDEIRINFKINRPEISKNHISQIGEKSLMINNQMVQFTDISEITLSTGSKKPIIAGSIIGGIGLLFTFFALSAYTTANSYDSGTKGVFVPPMVIFGGMAITGGGLIALGLSKSEKIYDMQNEWEFEER